ncbi:MAG: hypothetical protein FJ118_15860 [Deltaproteobacteria bacterium]|nr:hypothetical protein [Deltaproteobacteria bacterium]
MNIAEAAVFLSNELRLKTEPIGVKFLKSADAFPDKVRRPSEALGKRITICQAVTMARVYRWTMGLTGQDLICVPAMIAFGFTRAADPGNVLGKVFCDVSWLKDQGAARTETASMSFLPSLEYQAVCIAPLQRAAFEPDTISIYGNPAQVMRMIQAWTYHRGERIQGNFGGKVECAEYLIAPFKSGRPRAAIPGMGDRIFSMTQDDEMVFALPGQAFGLLIEGVKEAGSKVGARYPITFYQNFQPEFPKIYKTVGEELGAFSD